MISSGSPAAPLSTSTEYRSSATTNGTMDTTLHSFGVAWCIAKAHSAYVVTSTPADMVHTNRRYVGVDCFSTGRMSTTVSWARRTSAYLLPAAMNSDPKPASIRNHCESRMWVATPPAMALNKNPEATLASSMTGSCFMPRQYQSWTTS